MSSLSSSSPMPVSGPSASLPSSTTAWSTASPGILSLPAQRPPATEFFPPMTTHWTKPQSCTWTYVADSQSRPTSHGAVAWLDLQPIPGASTLSCYPGGMFFGGRTGVFSPATCPSGWTTVSLRVSTEKDLARPATTTAVCCSSYVNKSKVRLSAKSADPRCVAITPSTARTVNARFQPCWPCQSLTT